MFGFIDSASDHAAALSHFHSYAMFFLVLIIVFVVWLLKMILKFVVAERSLILTDFQTADSLIFNKASLAHFTYVGHLIFSLTAANRKLSALIYDLYYAFALTFNISKTFYSYGIQKTMYPDQGLGVNIFSTLPRLVFTQSQFRPYYSVGALTTLAATTLSGETAELLTIFRKSKHNISFLFPYERVEINSHGPYSSVEEYLTLQLYVAAFTLKLKHSSWARFFSSFSATKPYTFTFINVNKLFGFSVERSAFFYKTYSAYSLPFLTLIDFYGSESRMFFYLFFQQVKHRKILEWVWTCIPALILLVILYPSLILLYCYDRPYITQPYFTFKAIGHQWYWSYEYSDFVTSNKDELSEHIKFESYMLHQDDLEFGTFRLLEVDRRLILPLGVCLRLITTSSDVLHSWAVPALGVKIDAVPGRLNQFWIVADRPGTFYGQCSEICGVNHGFMPIVVEAADFTVFFKAINAALTNF